MDNKQPNQAQAVLIASAQILATTGKGGLAMMDIPGHGTLLHVPAEANPADLIDAAVALCKKRGVADRG